MLYLVTGVPGSGKTLWGMSQAMKLAATGRPVYQNGIPLSELGRQRLGWYELGDPETWWQLGATSVVLIDEAQRVFRPRPRGATVPKHFAEFETHRHSGIDVFLFTQDPMLIDSHVRKIVGKHIHIRRTFGMEAAKVTEWLSRVATNPTKKAEYADSRTSVWKYPKEVYDLYQSAEVHTHKADLPWKQFGYIAAGTVLFGLAVWEVRHHYVKSDQDETGKPAHQAKSVGPAAPDANEFFSVGRRNLGNPWSAHNQAPRVAGVPQTAPIYDALQEPVQQPTIAGCMSLVINGVVNCKCHTRQNSLIEMSTAQCVERMQKGWFDPTAKPVDVAELERARLDAHDAQSMQSGDRDQSVAAPNASAASLGAASSSAPSGQPAVPTAGAPGAPPAVVGASGV